MTRFVRKTISKHAKILSDPTLNIKQCRETLDELSNDAVPLAKEDVTSIAKALKHFADDCFIPIEYAHELLKSCGRLMDQDETENNLKIFTENTEFFLVLYHIVEDFANVANPSGESSLVPIMKNTSFINYQCYQAAIFLLLGMVDKSSTLMLFTKNIKKEYQRQLLIKLGSIILRDLSYVSQVNSIVVAAILLEVG